MIEILNFQQASRILGVWISQNGSYTEKPKRLLQITSSGNDISRSGNIRKVMHGYILNQ